MSEPISNSPEQSQLGKASAYVDQYDASLLFPIPRATKRAEIGITAASPFFGADIWTAYELSWLNPRGKPQIALAHVIVPCETANIVESKSFKLYLNSFNNTKFPSVGAVQARIHEDINDAVWQGHTSCRGTEAKVVLVTPEQFAGEEIRAADGTSLDGLDVACSHFTPLPGLLIAAPADSVHVTETLTTDLFKSNCLVTGQPDWASLQLTYTGPKINAEGARSVPARLSNKLIMLIFYMPVFFAIALCGAALLQYFVSFRNHNEFHEHCVERIWLDVWSRCHPSQLSVHAQFTRRGGIDICPFRTSSQHAPLPEGTTRHARQ